MKRIPILPHRLVLVAAVLAPASAFAQGANDCATPQNVAGTGNFNFDNTAATTGAQGQAYAACTDATNQTAITNDVWFTWTAPTSDTYSISTCGGTGMDSKMAVYAGAGCPAAGPLDCNDDSCGTQSTVQFAATSGSTYTIQLGNWPSAAGAAGTFAIAVYVPPPPCSIATGPDVIVGDIQDLFNAPVTGALDAISLGTTSCNVGTVNLNWFASVNQHPVIGGNLYRYRVESGSGRFEQIGQSWLKHGFYALSLELCCTNCQATDGTQLGVNCSDPYTAARNGSQPGLGPRFEVDAHTGAYPYPPTNPSWSGTTARRLEFLTSDVDFGAGVRYFGETQYVTPDDAAAGNQDNNASYRELSVANSGATLGATFALLGTTQRERPAIEAWKVVDPAVTVNPVHVPGEGLFHVAYRTTNVGGGTWHYEYAVHNLNSDRSGGSFSIAVPAGVTVTNVGFHDVAYRNGDGNGTNSFSGTDWSFVRNGNTLTWSTETQAQNALANALRWGTTYNFRFDANAAPTSGQATIGLWKSGSPASVATTVDVPIGPLDAPFCFGDGSGTACPCGNASAVGANAGCLNSLGAAGKLASSGTASVAADSVQLAGSGMPSGPCLYFQGTSALNGGAGVAFGDGLRCVGGTNVRLGVKTNSGAGTSAFPVGLDPLLHLAGGAVAGDVRHYAVWYRDSAAFCTANTYNLTNGWTLSWTP